MNCYSAIVLELVDPEAYAALNPEERADPNFVWWMNEDGNTCIPSSEDGHYTFVDGFWMCDPVIAEEE